MANGSTSLNAGSRSAYHVGCGPDRGSERITCIFNAEIHRGVPLVDIKYISGGESCLVAHIPKFSRYLISSHPERTSEGGRGNPSLVHPVPQHTFPMADKATAQVSRIAERIKAQAEGRDVTDPHVRNYADTLCRIAWGRTLRWYTCDYHACAGLDRATAASVGAGARPAGKDIVASAVASLGFDRVSCGGTCLETRDEAKAVAYAEELARRGRLAT